MSARVGFWVGGFAAGVALAAVVPEDLFPGARPALAGLTFLVIGLLGELAQAVGSWGAGFPGSSPPESRPPDGRVDLARVHGVRVEKNPADPRFGRFLGLGDGPETAVARSGVRRSPPLLGRVVVLSLFVGRHGRPWTVDEVAGAHQSLLRAGAWVEREAQRWGAAVNVELADTYFVADDDEPDEVAVGFVAEGDDVGPFEQGAGLKALVGASRAAARLGFRDAADLFQTVASRVTADATVWLVHPRQAGRSLAVPREESGWDGVSLAVCYCEEASFPEPLAGVAPARVDPVTVVHELLHLFGATDKYGRSLRDYEPRTVTGREVMRLDETRLSRLRVDPSTAAEIGWGVAGEFAEGR